MLFSVAAIASLAFSGFAQAAVVCTGSQRLAGAQQVVNAFNTRGIFAVQATTNALQAAPFSESASVSLFTTESTPAIPLSINRVSTVALGTASRPTIYGIAGTYTDFPANFTVAVNARIALGNVLFPFGGSVNAFAYFDYNTASCTIDTVRVYANVPQTLLQTIVQTVNSLVPGLNLPIPDIGINL